MALKEIQAEKWMNQPLSIVVFGASGDLAKKKTYPAMFDLFLAGLLPPSNTIVIGYARKQLAAKDFHAQLRPFLEKKHPQPEKKAKITAFLDICLYSQTKGYDDNSSLAGVSSHLISLHGTPKVENRVFYLALPPAAFIPSCGSIKASGLTKTGYNRVIVEKPFGNDTESAIKMSDDLGAIFPEEIIYRIDHYLGKEMVQSLMPFRFSNSWLEPLWSAQNVQAVIISFKEDIGTDGRGGYFDKSGIIRDIMQNHLMQVLSLVAMEAPHKLSGPDASDLIRDEKVKVLKSIAPWKLENTVLGQYTGDGKEKGYLDDPTVPRGSNCPTYASTVMYVNNRRWGGVPFIMKAGKALNERRCEVRLQLKAPPGVKETFEMEHSPPLNEIVIRIQPDEAVYIKTNFKTPGLSGGIVQSEVDLTFSKRYPDVPIPDAYTRLMLDVLRGKQENFVRKDELIQAWKLVTPLLKKIEEGEAEPIPYRFGTRGPKASDELVKKVGGYVVHKEYKWSGK